MRSEEQQAEWVRRCKLTPPLDDQVDEFLGQVVVREAGSEVRGGDLWAAFQRYAEAEEWLPEFTATLTRFGRTAGARFARRRDRRGVIYLDLRVDDPTQDSNGPYLDRYVVREPLAW